MWFSIATLNRERVPILGRTVRNQHEIDVDVLLLLLSWFWGTPAFFTSHWSSPFFWPQIPQPGDAAKPIILWSINSWTLKITNFWWKLIFQPRLPGSMLIYWRVSHFLGGLKIHNSKPFCFELAAEEGLVLLHPGERCHRQPPCGSLPHGIQSRCAGAVLFIGFLKLVVLIYHPPFCHGWYHPILQYFGFIFIPSLLIICSHYLMIYHLIFKVKLLLASTSKTPGYAFLQAPQARVWKVRESWELWF